VNQSCQWRVWLCVNTVQWCAAVYYACHVGLQTQQHSSAQRNEGLSVFVIALSLRATALPISLQFSLLLGCIERVRCWLLLPMFVVSVCLSVTRLKSAAVCAVYAACRMSGVIWCSFRQMPLASVKLWYLSPWSLFCPLKNSLMNSGLSCCLIMLNAAADNCWFVLFRCRCQRRKLFRMSSASLQLNARSPYQPSRAWRIAIFTRCCVTCSSHYSFYAAFLFVKILSKL